MISLRLHTPFLDPPDTIHKHRAAFSAAGVVVINPKSVVIDAESVANTKG